MVKCVFHFQIFSRILYENIFSICMIWFPKNLKIYHSVTTLTTLMTDDSEDSEDSDVSDVSDDSDDSDESEDSDNSMLTEPL